MKIPNVIRERLTGPNFKFNGCPGVQFVCVDTRFFHIWKTPIGRILNKFCLECMHSLLNHIQS